MRDGYKYSEQTFENLLELHDHLKCTILLLIDGSLLLQEEAKRIFNQVGEYSLNIIPLIFFQVMHNHILPDTNQYLSKNNKDQFNLRLSLSKDEADVLKHNYRIYLTSGKK